MIRKCAAISATGKRTEAFHAVYLRPDEGSLAVIAFRLTYDDVPIGAHAKCSAYKATRKRPEAYHATLIRPPESFTIWNSGAARIAHDRIPSSVYGICGTVRATVERTEADHFGTHRTCADDTQCNN